ncbi:hypothetical protein PPL_04488 [Heterostelium album PN500]|uniref:Uncharacterized protein n=1 Tax=Heterostelium pallidum (strain ATCC 26659 / Pp 5 / PN500) TaxID=670386 RepID=D3B7Q0_HETP5|nr:hypothetical protein PPL_04488 [Heterostelium album PN500]EFA82793.1 hypothetical protein PPL_04488 [Heterostelium album PN500]|eukprot:XP_020434910.1 hypothetical protein PPL_04488 [Heterostelium album PN500]
MSNNFEDSLDFEIRFLNSSLNINNKLLILNILKKYSTFTLKDFMRGNEIGAIDPPFFNQVVEGENYSFHFSSFEVKEKLFFFFMKMEIKFFNKEIFFLIIKQKIVPIGKEFARLASQYNKYSTQT